MYPDQVVYKKTAGIPYDVELARDEVRGMEAETGAIRDEAAALRDDAQAQRRAAESARDAARSHATAAEASALEAERWATAKAGISLGPDEPPDATAGSVWLQTEGAGGRVIVAVKRYDPGLAGAAVFPAADLYPAAGLYPEGMGAWEQFTFAGNLVTA